MDGAIITLIAANIAFVGTHFAMSHPLRAAMVKPLGETGFQIVYSLVSLATLVWVYFAFTAAAAADLPGTGDIGWAIATVLSWPAMVLLAGSFAGNPALGLPGSDDMARAQPKGMMRVTRHPMMWGFALWALSHMVLLVSVRTMITAFAIGFLALVGAHMQDRKKQVLMGDAWKTWETNTGYWPRWGQLLRVGPVPLIVGTALWLGASWLHLWQAGIPAGVWRWL